jgi:hypothetical protein
MMRMRTVAHVISYLFHPLLMPTIGLVLLLNSGTYLSLLDPAAKRAILFVMALGTLIFPLLMLPVLYYRRLVSNLENVSAEERAIPMLIILVLYVITFIYFLRMPLSRIIHAYALALPLVILVLLVMGLVFKLSEHMTALGGLTGLVISVILLYETPMELILMILLLAAGLTGTARLKLGLNRPAELFWGYMAGFVMVMGTLLIY